MEDQGEGAITEKWGMERNGKDGGLAAIIEKNERLGWGM